MYWTRLGGGESVGGEAQERLKRRNEGLNGKLWNMEGEQVRGEMWSCDSHMIRRERRERMTVEAASNVSHKEADNVRCSLCG